MLMTFIKLFHLILIVLVSPAGVNEPQLTALPSSKIPLGCGCTFSFISKVNTEIFAVSDLTSDTLLVGINDGFQEFALVLYQEKKQRKSRVSVGDKIIEEYKSNEIKFKLSYEVSFVCPEVKRHDGCEITRYKGKASLVTTKDTTEYSIKGKCGC